MLASAVSPSSRMIASPVLRKVEGFIYLLYSDFRKSETCEEFEAISIGDTST